MVPQARVGVMAIGSIFDMVSGVLAMLAGLGEQSQATPTL
jgi:hypothetical protein